MESIYLNIKSYCVLLCYAEPRIFLTSPGLFFVQKVQMNCRLFFYSMKIIHRKSVCQIGFSIFTKWCPISHILFSQEISSVSICCLNCCAYSLRCHLKWHVMKCIILCTGCCRNCHKLLVCHFCDTKFF